MKYLPLPTDAAKDDAKLLTTCTRRGWMADHPAWLQAFNNYRAHGGNPWLVPPSSSFAHLHANQKALYESRKDNGPIVRVRQTPGLGSCPMCGSPTTGTVDHYLPQDAYPEFSVLFANLVPACTHCNSSLKGGVYKGVKPERFIHPYFDKFANGALWKVGISSPYRAAVFSAEPLSVPGVPLSIVEFHLKSLLGNQFRLFAANQWSTYPSVLASNVAQGFIFSNQDVDVRLRADLRSATISEGINSWRAALWRGIIADSSAISYLAQEATIRAK